MMRRVGSCAVFAAMVLCSTSAFVLQPVGLGSSPSRVGRLQSLRPNFRHAASMSLDTKEKTENAAIENNLNAVEEKSWSLQQLMSSSKEEIYSYVKSYGPAGIASIVIVGGVFWALYIPVIIFSYHQATGEWITPQLILFPVGASKVAVTALGFWSLARVLFPLRMAAAVAITPMVKTQIFDRFSKGSKSDDSTE